MLLIVWVMFLSCPWVRSVLREFRFITGPHRSLRECGNKWPRGRGPHMGSWNDSNAGILKRTGQCPSLPLLGPRVFLLVLAHGAAFVGHPPSSGFIFQLDQLWHWVLPGNSGRSFLPQALGETLWLILTAITSTFSGSLTRSNWFTVSNPLFPC